MYSIAYIVILAIVLAAVWYIFNTVVELPAKAKQVVNIVLIAILAILAVKLLLGFV